jgi:hypothetical protein
MPPSLEQVRWAEYLACMVTRSEQKISDRRSRKGKDRAFTLVTCVRELLLGMVAEYRLIVMVPSRHPSATRWRP